jgi:hypothetical protein
MQLASLRFGVWTKEGMAAAEVRHQVGLYKLNAVDP